MREGEAQKIRPGVSACLLGQQVRYDGGHKRDPFLTDTLGPFVEWIPVCPEVEIGLGVPRDTIRLVGEAAAPRLVVDKTGEDLTARINLFKRRLDPAERAELFDVIRDYRQGLVPLVVPLSLTSTTSAGSPSHIWPIKRISRRTPKS